MRKKETVIDQSFRCPGRGQWKKGMYFNDVELQKSYENESRKMTDNMNEEQDFFETEYWEQAETM